MKIYFAFLLTLMSFAAIARQDSVVHKPVMQHPTYLHNTITATVAVGFIDWYRHYYTLPPAFRESNTTGFSPFYGKIEYGTGNRISIAACFAYDAFVNNFNQVYQGYNGPILRYKTNNTRIFGGGLTAYYHFGKMAAGKRLDPFIGVGLSLNNIRYGAFPEGDSTSIKLEHTISPVLRAGARYYITDVFSVYGDIGFDKLSIFSLGASCRFFREKNPKP